MPESMQRLAQIDQALTALLATPSDVDTQTLEQLLAQREQVLQHLQAEPAPLDKAQWQAAIERTTGILTQLQQHREQAAQQMQRLVHGQRSLQMYNKFR
ncbi:hypothetical flagellar rod protein FlaI [Photobacterium aphoticum]|uniref:Flagellar protein FliT n=1 Tax=Photobacterium aphoticum TaxID=754436 RepID=A0A090QVH8_9GAMM|nr:hypothetical flagellar rod protein FlaI [Photobacterium aphoticum]